MISLDSTITLKYIGKFTCQYSYVMIENVPPLVEGNKYSDSQLDIVQCVRQHGTLYPKQDVSSKSVPPVFHMSC